MLFFRFLIEVEDRQPWVHQWKCHLLGSAQKPLKTKGPGVSVTFYYKWPKEYHRGVWSSCIEVWMSLPSLLRRQHYPSWEGLACQGWVAFGGAYCSHRENKKFITPPPPPPFPSPEKIYGQVLLLKWQLFGASHVQIIFIVYANVALTFRWTWGKRRRKRWKRQQSARRYGTSYLTFTFRTFL